LFIQKLVQKHFEFNGMFKVRQLLIDLILSIVFVVIELAGHHVTDGALVKIVELPRQVL
jgi:hypothetical protein